MRKINFVLLTLFSVLSLSALQAQQQASALPVQQAALKIKGNGEIRVAPDLAVVNMTVKATDMDFNQAVKALNQQTDKLQNKLQSAGFKHTEIKTSQLNVQENGHWRSGEYTDSGFVAMQHIELRFKRDQQRIGRLMEAFADEQGAEALFQLGFALSDEVRQEAGEELIRKAIMDARSKATVIAKTSGVKLGKIRNISYGQPDFQPMPMYNDMAMNMRMSSAEAKQGVADMEVREIEMQDDIIVVWDIE
jgi:uncharacterized protein YggE